MEDTGERTIRVDRTLRPLRLAFLLRPSDHETFRAVLEANTSRWGGVFNPIIPRYRARPAHWEQRIGAPPSAAEIAQGYLKVFEPDFVVRTAERQETGLELNERLVIPFSELQETERVDGSVTWGLSAFALYRDAYLREFRFVRRHAPEVVLPVSADSKNELLVGTLFGLFPADRSLGFLRRAYEDAFEPSRVEVTADNYLETLRARPGVGTPLGIGAGGIERRPARRFHERLVFLFDGRRVADLMEFWNLRALGHRPLPVPRGWVEGFLRSYKQLQEDHRIAPLNDDEGLWVTGARRVSDTEVKNLASELRGVARGKVGVGFRLDLWDDQQLRLNHFARVRIRHRNDDVEVTSKDGRVQFSPLAPNWEGDTGMTWRAAWVNTVRLRDWGFDSDLAAVFPPDLDDVTRLVEGFGPYPVTATSEGIVVRADSLHQHQFWTLPTGEEVFRAWLARHGFAAELSPAGRTASQLIHAVGGLERTAIVEHPPLIRLLDRAARGLVEETSATGQSRRRVISYDEIMTVLRSLHAGAPERARGHLAELVGSRVLRQGLVLQCPLCEQTNWYAIAELDDQQTCERCLRPFPFPVGAPPERNEWAYRPQGPFSTPGCADGGYAVALALRFFVASVASQTDNATWVASMVDRRGNGGFEFDFGVWLEPRFGVGDEPNLVLGECKTFNAFESRDFRRARRLATTFPQATFAFATLRHTISDGEQTELRKLYATGRRGGYYPMDGRIVVLTAHELCDPDSHVLGPPYIWKGKGGRFDEVAERYSRQDDIAALSRATLELHAGLTPPS